MLFLLFFSLLPGPLPALRLRGRADCYVDSNITCLLDDICPGGGMNMTCTRPKWWSPAPTPAPTPVPGPRWVNVSELTECADGGPHPLQEGVNLSTSIPSVTLMPASAPVLLQNLTKTHPCYKIVTVLAPPLPLPPPTPPPPIVEGKCFCNRGCWSADEQRCLVWDDHAPFDHSLHHHGEEVDHGDWAPSKRKSTDRYVKGLV
jgi:hypothetical protein